MAQLNSPGVSVSVIDESFYTPAAPGTVPLIIVASAENKQNGAGTGTAPGTLQTDAGNVRLLTSQKDLSDIFGTPVFQTDANGNPIHAGELNEYGLQAAYSYLGVSNRAYVVRANIDLGQLEASATEPAGTPADGTYWLDTSSSSFGIFEWNAASAISGGQIFTNQTITVLTAPGDVVNFTGSDFTPVQSIGAIGDYAVVAVTGLNKLWYKKALTHTNAGIWVEVGSPEWVASWPTVQGATPGVLTGTDSFKFTIGASEWDIIGPTTITGLRDAIINGTQGASGLAAQGISAEVINGHLEIYSTGKSFELSGANVTVARSGIAAGTYNAPKLQITPHTTVPEFKTTDTTPRPTGSVWVKTTTPNLGANWKVKSYNSATKSWITNTAPLYKNSAEALAKLDSTGGGLNLALGRVYVKFDDSEQDGTVDGIRSNFKIYARNGVGPTVIRSATIKAGTFNTGSNTFTVSETTSGSSLYTSAETITFVAEGLATDINLFLAAFNGKMTGTNITASKDTATNSIIITHTEGGDIKLVDISNDPIASAFNVLSTANLYADPAYVSNHYVASLWTSTVGGATFAVASPTALTTAPADQTLWYSSIVDEVDVMIHNGTTWVGYKNFNQTLGGQSGPTDANGPIVSASKPTKQSDGVTALGNGDLWIDTSDLENYPKLYRYNFTTKLWVLVDTTDQTTENGIVFDDARWSVDGGTTDAPTSSSIQELLTSNFLDFDAPDPALYPKGMLLWNTRRSGFNVKKFVRNYVNTLSYNDRYPHNTPELMTDYYPHRWVTISPNQENGAGTFGRKAQRRVVVQALQATVNSNQQIRDDESRIFNLIACPGYPELIGELINLNYDRGLTAFVVGDTPARLAPDATTLSNWGQNVNGAVEDNDSGLVSFDEYLGVFYPWGYTSDNLGNNIVVPPSHMMLRTIALSDQVSYPWFAPAGTRRGGITNASAVGYITAEGEFQSVALNNGQRDTLQQQCKVNPITYITGTGLVSYGQLTRAKNASALDRINVARLVIYLRRQFTQLAKPYVFEPNDKITRDEIKGAAENLLLELVGQRALYDYLVVCDESNNTPTRIDRNELYLDVAIEPVKAVEFIYIPLRLKNTGEIKALGK